jgi:hypothetical protein
VRPASSLSPREPIGPMGPWSFGAHPSMRPPSPLKVCQVDPCGPLLFALALQSPLEKVRYAFLDVCVVACADDEHLQGPPEATIKGFWRLFNATAPISLAPSLPKCAASAWLPTTSSTVASALSGTHRPEGLVAAGTPLGSDVFVEADARSRPNVTGLVTALAFLPLGRQDKFLLLRSFLQARPNHLTCITLWSRLFPHVPVAKRQVLLAALVDHPPPAAMWSDPVVAQLALPLRSRGFGLRLTTPLEPDADFLAAASTADMAMRPALPPFQPVIPVSPHCCAHRSVGSASRRGARPLVPELWALNATLLALVFLHAQREYGLHLADRRFADLLASAPTSSEGTQFRARLNSCACRPASIWFETMPTSFPLTLSHLDFTPSTRLRLGLLAGPANAPALRCDCVSPVLLQVRG